MSQSESDPSMARIQRPTVSNTPGRVSQRLSKQLLVPSQTENVGSNESLVELPNIAEADVSIPSSAPTIESQEVLETADPLLETVPEADEEESPAKKVRLDSSVKSDPTPQDFNDSVVATEEKEKTSITRVETTTTLEVLVGQESAAFSQSESDLSMARIQTPTVKKTPGRVSQRLSKQLLVPSQTENVGSNESSVELPNIAEADVSIPSSAPTIESQQMLETADPILETVPEADGEESPAKKARLDSLVKSDPKPQEGSEDDGHEYKLLSGQIKYGDNNEFVPKYPA